MDPDGRPGIGTEKYLNHKCTATLTDTVLFYTKKVFMTIDIYRPYMYLWYSLILYMLDMHVIDTLHML